MDHRRQNLSWLERMAQRHRVGEGFVSQVKTMLSRHGLIEGPIPEGIRNMVEETYRREERRLLSCERAQRAIEVWRQTLEETAITLREAKESLEHFQRRHQASAPDASPETADKPLIIPPESNKTLH
jgi:hypothetical protein